MPYTPTNPICSVSDVKAALRITSTTDDDRIGLAVDAASRMLEAELGRQFWQTPSASERFYAALTPFETEVDDFTDTADLVVKCYPFGQNDTGSAFVMDSTQYQLEPLNGIERGQQVAYHRIRAVGSVLFPVYGGIAYPLPFVQALVGVTTKWGWGFVPSPLQKAAILQASMLFKVDDAPLGATINPETGVLRLPKNWHPTALALIQQWSEDEVFIE